MSFTPAEPIQPPTYSKMKFDGTVNHASQVILAANGELASGRLDWLNAEGRRRPDGSVYWRIRFQRPNSEDELLAEADFYIVVSSTGVFRVLDEAAYLAEFQPDPV